MFVFAVLVTADVFLNHSICGPVRGLDSPAYLNTHAKRMLTNNKRCYAKGGDKRCCRVESTSVTKTAADIYYVLGIKDADGNKKCWNKRCSNKICKKVPYLTQDQKDTFVIY